MDDPQKTVLITGAAGGIGKATAGIFRANGFRVLAADIDVKPLHDHFPDEERVIVYGCDIRDPRSVRQLVSFCNERKISISVLVQCAGIYDTFPVTEVSAELFRNTMEVNFLGQQSVLSAFLDQLIRNRGRVITVSSESYRLPALFQPYMISKAALEAFAVTARQELMLKGVKMIIIRPGAVSTQLLKWREGIENPTRNSVYTMEFKRAFDTSLKMVGRITIPGNVAKKIFRAAVVNNPRRVYTINNSMLLRLMSSLPNGLKEYALRRLMR